MSVACPWASSSKQIIQNIPTLPKTLFRKLRLLYHGRCSILRRRWRVISFSKSEQLSPSVRVSPLTSVAKTWICRAILLSERLLRDYLGCSRIRWLVSRSSFDQRLRNCLKDLEGAYKAINMDNSPPPQVKASRLLTWRDVRLEEPVVPAVQSYARLPVTHRSFWQDVHRSRVMISHDGESVKGLVKVYRKRSAVSHLQKSYPELQFMTCNRVQRKQFLADLHLLRAFRYFDLLFLL